MPSRPAAILDFRRGARAVAVGIRAVGVRAVGVRAVGVRAVVGRLEPPGVHEHAEHLGHGPRIPMMTSPARFAVEGVGVVFVEALDPGGQAVAVRVLIPGVRGRGAVGGPGAVDSRVVIVLRLSGRVVSPRDRIPTGL